MEPHVGIFPKLARSSKLARVKMKKKKIESVLERMTEASLGQEFTIPLDQIKQDPALYRHRDEADLDPKKEMMQALEKSLITDGQRDPIHVIKLVPREGVSEGVAEFQQVTGHRRVAAMRHLAETNVPGFTYDMPVRAREILNGDHHDYLIWSVADNVIREQIDELYRVKATIRLIKEKVDHARIKANLKLSDSTFERIRRLAESQWMLGHVERNEIGLTDAYLLLEVAGGKGGLTALKNLKEDLGRQVAAVARKTRPEGKSWPSGTRN